MNDIVSSADAWQLVDDGDTDDRQDNATEIRPTVSARRVKTLVEQITGTHANHDQFEHLKTNFRSICADRYRHLPHLAHRLQFLLDVQLPILESYHARISSSLDAYENLSSSLMRAVPGALAGQAGHGIDRTRLTSGVEGLGRLFKAFVSASWVKEALETWGEELVGDSGKRSGEHSANLSFLHRYSWSCGQTSTINLLCGRWPHVRCCHRRTRGAPQREHCLTR